MKDYDAVGIGNALIDILAHVDETYPQKFGLEKGAFNLVDEKKIAEIMGAIQNFNPKFVPAGSSANVIKWAYPTSAASATLLEGLGKTASGNSIIRT